MAKKATLGGGDFVARDKKRKRLKSSAIGCAIVAITIAVATCGEEFVLWS